MSVTRKLRPRTTPAPAGLIAVGDINAINLAWSYPTPPFDFTRFDIYRDDDPINPLATSTTTSYRDEDAAANVEYEYTIVAVRTNPYSSRAYQSTPSSPASASWTDNATADIEIVSVANNTTGVTILVNPVTGADHYRLERSTDPLTGFAQVGSDFATTTLTDATGTAGTLYFYRVKAVTSGTPGTASRSRVGTKTGTVGGDAITLGALTLTPMYNTIHIDQAVSGDTNESARGWAEFGLNNIDGTITWRHTVVPLMRRGTSFIGAAVELTDATSYTIRVTVTDTGGVSGLPFKEATENTWTDDTPTYAELLAGANRYVDFANGDDTTGTGLVGAPWRTLNKAYQMANAANAGWTILLKAGYNPTATTQLTTPMTVVAENPALDEATADDYAPYNTGVPHSVVYYRFTAPASSDITLDEPPVGLTAANTGIYGKGGWTVFNPSGHPEWPVWRKDVGTQGIKQVHYTDATAHGSYAAAKAAEPLRCGVLKKDGTAGRLLNTVEGFCEFLYTNDSYAYGAYQDGGANTFLYLRLPDDVDPNDCYIWLGRYLFSENNVTTAADINGPNITVAGLNVRAVSNGFRLRTNASDVLLMRNHTQGCGCPYAPFKNADGIGAKRVTIQDFRAVDTNIWNEDRSGIPWLTIKQNYVMSNDGTGIYGSVGSGAERVDHTTNYPVDAVMGAAEISVVKFNQGGKAFVIRRGDVDGIFNGFGSTGSSTVVGAQRDVDIHNINFANVGDNCIEPEGMATGWVMWDHKMRNCRSYLSTDSDGGAHIFFRIQAWRWGNHGLGPGVQGFTTNSMLGGVGQFVKFGAGSSPRPHFWFLFTTAWTDVGTSRGWAKAISSSSQEKFHLRNCIIRVPDDIIDNDTSITEWDSDYNLFATTAVDAGIGMTLKATNYNSSLTTGANSLAAARLAGVQGANDNRLASTDYNFNTTGVALIDGLMTNTATGDLALDGVASGTPWPNIADDGSTPSRGYEG